MKKLHFHYEMQLQLAGTAVEHYFRLRCLPRREAWQEDLGTEVVIHPSESHREIRDGFGNRCLSGEIRGAHSSFDVTADGLVLVELSRRTPEEADGIFRYPSFFTEPGEAVRQLYHETVEAGSRDGGAPTVSGMAVVQRLMEALYGRMRYVPGVTTVQTRAEEALAGGQGVCQDYAHIFISLCRLAGIPARYVAGAMKGEGATHAWTEVWIGGLWLGVDPTNRCMTDETYITFSHGRDYGDCTVDRGCFRGPMGQSQTILVKVEEA